MNILSLTGPVLFGPTPAPAASSPHHYEAGSGSPHVAPTPSALRPRGNHPIHRCMHIYH